MEQKRVTIRFNAHDFRMLETLAAGAGVSVSEVIRARAVHAESSEKNDSTLAAILAAISELSERETSASSNADIAQLNDTISAIIAAIQRQESALLSLAEHVKISRSSASVSQQRSEHYTPPPAPPQAPEPPPEPAPTRPVPGRPHWREWLAVESKKHADSGETLIQRNLRLKKVYAQIYGPIDD